MSHLTGGTSRRRQHLPALMIPSRSCRGNGGILGGGLLQRAPHLRMSAHSIAVTADVDDVTMVEEPVNQRRRHDVVAKDVAPLLEALVAGEHGGGVLVATAHQLKEMHGAGSRDWQVADLVDHEQRGGA